MPDEAQALAEELASALRASTFWRPGGEDESCHYIYVLCVGREPALVQIRDGGVPFPAELAGADPQELYLRVCLSDMARVAGVQEVAMSMLDLGDRVAIVERPRGGVYQAPLLARMQKLVAILPAYEILHLDFGDISAPVPEFAPGPYAALYGGAPCTANYLFYPQPINAESTVVVDKRLPLLATG